jgi:hypothetical protein
MDIVTLVLDFAIIVFVIWIMFTILFKLLYLFVRKNKE